MWYEHLANTNTLKNLNLTMGTLIPYMSEEAVINPIPFTGYQQVQTDAVEKLETMNFHHEVVNNCAAMSKKHEKIEYIWIQRVITWYILILILFLGVQLRPKSHRPASEQL